MRQIIKEGIGLAEQLAALPFTAARQAFQSAEASQGQWGDVVRESLGIGEGLARLPFKAAVALLATRPGASQAALEQRVAELERRVGVQPPPPPPPADSPG